VSGRISFIGAGPGAADLITMRGARRIAEADIVVWAASLVTPECVQEHARADAEVIDSSRLTHEEAVEIYRRAERDRLKVARVHSGDPSLWGAVQEQYDACARMELEVEIVPGVPAFSAAAAAVGRELTVPEVAQSVVLTRLEGGKTPMPAGERVREFAKHGTTMALFLSAARTGQLVEEMRAGGYPDDVPVLVAYKVTWPDELILRTTLGELEKTVKQHKLWRHTLFLVGRALKEGGTRSRLYHAGHFHTYRRADPAARKALRAGRTTPSAPSAPDADEVVRRTSQPNPDTAWRAVRSWQETARDAARGASSRASASGRKAARDEQSDLFGESGAQDSASEAVAADQAPVVTQDDAAAESVATPQPAPVASEVTPEPKQPPVKQTPAARKTTGRAETTAKARKNKTSAKSGRSGGSRTTSAKNKPAGESERE
jgi:precorrin-4 C11-methyltransferase